MHSTLALCQVRRGVHDEKGLMTPKRKAGVLDMGLGQGLAAS